MRMITTEVVMEQHPGMVAHLMVGWTGKRKIGGNLNRLRNTTLMEPGGGAQSIAQQPLNDSVIPGFLWPAMAIKFFTLLPVSLVDSMPTKIHIYLHLQFWHLTIGYVQNYFYILAWTLHKNIVIIPGEMTE